MHAAFRQRRPGYDCPFCAVVRGDDVRGGTLQQDVVVRDPAATAWEPYELEGELAAAVHDAAGRIALAMKTAYRCDGISTRQHNEPGGDQEVWHYHLHVFPRYRGDQLYTSSYRETTPEERRPYAERLREALAP